MKHTPAVICGRMPFINEYDESRLLETGQHPDTFRNYLKKLLPDSKVHKYFSSPLPNLQVIQHQRAGLPNVEPGPLSVSGG